MTERAKITASHLARHAVVYLRQSSAAQVEHNRESTERQYALASKARDLGWPDERVVVIDEDLGQRHRHPRRVGLLHDRRLLFRRPPPPAPDRRDYLNVLDLPSHRHRHTPGS